MTIERPMFPPVDPTRRHLLTLAAGGAVAVVLPAAALTAAPAVDPIFAVIERHRQLSADCDAAVAISGNMRGDDPEFKAADAITGECHDLLIDHANTVIICSQPTTLAGIVALMRYVASLEEWQEPVDHKSWEDSDGITMNWHQAFLATMSDALEALAGKEVQS